MLGTRAEPCLKTKTAETFSLSLFMLYVLSVYKHRNNSNWQRLLQAGQHLMDILLIWKRSNWVMTSEDRVSAMRHYVQHVGLMVPFEVYIPKHHVIFHLLHRSNYFGNPSYYATWHDESLNQLLKASCKNASVVCWEATVLLKMSELLRMEHAREHERARGPA